MSTTKRLREVAEIYLGQTFREKAEAADSSSGIRLIQIKDIHEGEMISVDHLPYAVVHSGKIRLEPEEILLPLRGTRTEAMIFRASKNLGEVTTTNQIAIIKPKNQTTTLNFLHWFFNSSIGKAALDKARTGVTIPNISIKNLSEIEIPTPSIAAQNRVVELYDNWQQQKEALNEILQNGEKLTNLAYKNIIRGTS